MVAAYGLILPRAVLAGTARGCLNIHASLLAALAGGGADPAGDHGRGRRDRRLDHGDGGGARHRAGASRRGGADRGARHRGQRCTTRLAALGARLIVEALGGLDRLAPVPQPEAGVTYAAKIDKAEARVDWRRPAEEVDRLIRGLSPASGGLVRDRRRAGEAAPERAGRGRGALRGTVLDDRLAVACGEGAVRLLSLQRAGGGAVEAAAFLRGTAGGGGVAARLTVRRRLGESLRVEVERGQAMRATRRAVSFGLLAACGGGRGLRRRAGAGGRPAAAPEPGMTPVPNAGFDAWVGGLPARGRWRRGSRPRPSTRPSRRRGSCRG